jgi:hypothetical protein
MCEQPSGPSARATAANPAREEEGLLHLSEAFAPCMAGRDSISTWDMVCRAVILLGSFPVFNKLMNIR